MPKQDKSYDLHSGGLRALFLLFPALFLSSCDAAQPATEAELLEEALEKYEHEVVKCFRVVCTPNIDWERDCAGMEPARLAPEIYKSDEKAWSNEARRMYLGLRGDEYLVYSSFLESRLGDSEYSESICQLRSDITSRSTR